MKKLILSLVAIMAMYTTNAQNAKESSIEFLKSTQPCVEANYNRPSDLMEEALKKRLSDAKIGSGDKAKGGFRVYKGVIVPEISTDKIDLYTKVDGKKENATVYILVSKGYDNFVTSAKEEVTVGNMKNFLNGLEINAASLKLLADIEAAKEAVIKAEDKYKTSIEEGTDLVSQKEKIERKIAENKENQSAKQKEVKGAKDALETLRALLK